MPAITNRLAVGQIIEGATGAGVIGADASGVIQDPGTYALPAGSVGAAQLATGAVETAKLADDAVTQAKIGAGAVGATELASDAVTTAKVLDDAITTAKIADGNVTGDLLDNYNARQADVAWIESRLAALGSKSRLQPSVEIVSDTSAIVRRPLGGLDFERIEMVRTDTGRPWSLRGQYIRRDAAWQHLSTYESTVAGTWSPVYTSSYCGGCSIQNATDSGTQTLTRTVTGQGQLWLRFTRRPSVGFTYVSVKDSLGVERCCLPISATSGNRYYDGYGAIDFTDDVVMIASGLEQGTYTVMLTKQATEKNASSSGYRSLPVALAWIDANAPSFGSPEQKRVRSLPRYVVTTQSLTPTNRHNASSIATSGDFSALTFAVGDTIDIGHHAVAGHEHIAVDIQVSVANTNGSTLEAELWNGSAWVAATITDGTNGFQQSGRILLASPPSTMNITSVNSLSGYWFRLKVATTGTSAVSVSGIALITRQTSAPINVATIIGNQTEVGYAVDVEYNNVWAEAGGQAHGMETPTSSKVFVDGLEVGGAGAYARGSRIVFRDTGNLVHPEGTIGTFKRDHAISRDRTDISGVWTLTEAVTVGQGTGSGTIGNSFPAMWACGLSSAGSWQMRQAAILHRPLVKRDLTTATSRTLFGTGTPGIGWVWADSAHPYAVLAWMPRAAEMLNGGGASDVYLDVNRADVAIPANGSDAKGYAQMAERTFASGEVLSMGVTSTTLRADQVLESLR